MNKITNRTWKQKSVTTIQILFHKNRKEVQKKSKLELKVRKISTRQIILFENLYNVDYQNTELTGKNPSGENEQNNDKPINMITQEDERSTEKSTNEPEGKKNINPVDYHIRKLIK